MSKHADPNDNSFRSKIPVIVAIALAALIIVVAVILLLLPGGDSSLLPEGTTINGVDVSNMDRDAALAALQADYTAKNSAGVTVHLSDNQEFFVSLAEGKTEPDFAALIDQAFSESQGFLGIGKTAPSIESGDTPLNENTVSEIVSRELGEIQDNVITSTMDKTASAISITKGAASITYDADELTRLVMDALNRGLTEITYEGTVNEDEISLQDIYDSVYREPEDAYYDASSGKIVPEADGISFDMEKAQKAWNNAKYGDIVTIPLIITVPEVTEESLNESLFADKLSSKTTTLKGSSSNRINNVTKACSSIDGLVLSPGDVFDYNNVLGERTKENGYLEAGAYENGQTVSQYGGGICQVSSMCYYCALYANLKINTRTNHMFPVSYIEPGLDATVSWGGPEFRFTNDRDYPIRIVAYVDGNDATVEFWGTDVDGSYVEMQYYTYDNYDTTYTDVVIGYSAVTTRCVYDRDGTLVSRNREAYSTYSYHPENIKWPEESEAPSPSPTESPEPSPEVTPEISPELTPETTATPEVSPAPEEPPQPTPSVPVETPQT